MFWTVVLPAQITFGLLLGLIVISVVRAPESRQRSTFVRAVLLGVILFVPSCAMIMTVADFYRFGVFNYAETASVSDSRVRRYLPEAATGITVAKSPSGYKAKFKINKADLEEWHRYQFKLAGEAAILPEKPLESGQVFSGVFDARFGHLQWKMPSDAVEYTGPARPNGAGYSIWYSFVEQIAYQDVGYW